MDNIQYGRTIKRLLTYFKYYKFRTTLALILVLVSSAVSVASAAFLRLLIDDFITPLLGNQNPVFDALLQALIILAVIYLCWSHQYVCHEKADDYRLTADYEEDS